MIAIAGREVAARPEQRLARFGNYTIGASAVAFATLLTAILALTTAIRPTPGTIRATRSRSPASCSAAC